MRLCRANRDREKGRLRHNAEVQTRLKTKIRSKWEDEEDTGMQEGISQVW